MKKIILSAAILAFAGLATVKANDLKSPLAITVRQDSTTKTPVKIEELPDAVKKTLASDAYKDWVPGTAFLVTGPNKSEWYEIEGKKADAASTLKIGKDGVVAQ